MEPVPVQCVACRARYEPALDEAASCPRCGCATWVAAQVVDAGRAQDHADGPQALPTPG